MIVFCSLCRTAYYVEGDPLEVKYLLDMPEEWKKSFPCVTPLCQGRLTRVTGPKLEKLGRIVRETHHVPLHGFYRAIHGFGMPVGDPAPVELSKKMLLTKRIVEVHADEVGQPKRTILKRLVLEDGTRLHFSRSTRGACLYYVERPGPSCVEVFDGSLDDHGAGSDEVRPEIGEEAGRGLEASEDGQAGGPAAGAEVPGPGVPSLQSAEGLPPGPGE
jgi:hypothetical protein